MPVFRFDGTKTFDANWSAFMAELQSVDADMAAILEANKDKLASIVRQGERHNNERSALNAAVVKALDALQTPAAGGPS